MNYKIGTRGSKLALYQAGEIQELLAEACPEDTFELQVVKTKGDTVTDRPLDQVGGSGVFVKEIEKQLLSGEIQLAVHSMKDMPREQPEELTMMPVGKREDPRDVLVLREKDSLEDLPQGAVIATGSSRRKCQLLALRPDLTIVGIRGNIETRIRKMHEQKLDGIILAAAGMKRLGLEEQITQYFEPEEMIPAPAQGILAIEMRTNDKVLNDKIKRALFFSRDQTHMLFVQAAAERLFLEEMEADCTQPIGAYLTKKEDHYLFYALYGRKDDGSMVRIQREGSEPFRLVRDAAVEIRRKICGKVILVGAGPGDPGLITVKGKDALAHADCILYDRLIAPELLQFARADCECIYVGKADSHHVLPQNKINALLLKKALQHTCVVRLKGGDPYVFGRGGEEASYLTERGIRCEVIPGVTAATAALAYAGIPLTYRGMAQGFHAVTAHARENQEPEIDYAGMAASTDTCVFFMGLSELPQIIGGLIKAGKPASTPAAVISHGTTATQRTCTGTLSDIEALTSQAGLTSPAIIVVGDVVRLHERLNSFEQQPLFGRKYLVAEVESGMKKKIGTLSERLKSCGAQVERVITGRIERIAATWTADQLRGYDWILFTSRNGVIAFFENLWESGLDARILGQAKIACIGSSTAEMLEDYHFQADYIAKGRTGRIFGTEMVDIFIREGKADGTRVLYPQNRADRHSLTDALDGACKLTELQVYENILPAAEFTCHTDEELLACDGICFTNASGAQRFLGERSPELLQKLSDRGIVYAIGQETAQVLKNIGCESLHMPAEPSYEDMIDLIIVAAKNKV